MKLLILGDLACPEKEDVIKLRNLINLFKDKVVIANLEGLLVDKKDALEKYNNALFNNIEVLEIFKETKKTIFSLANNHIKDIPEVFDYTIEKLNEKNIGFAGASRIEEESSKPYIFKDGSKEIVVFTHCWNVMSEIIYNKSKDIYIYDVDYEKFINQVKIYKQEHPNSYIITYLHWNFDFEKLPFPAHRVIATKLAQNGANLILGGHSHLVNGAEKINNSIAVYGFGNFYIPSNKFLNKKLIYPKESKLTLALELDFEENKAKCYWIENSEKDIRIIKDEDFDSGDLINRYSPFRDMEERKYKKYFKGKRAKRTLVPIWYNEKNSFINKLKDYFILARMKLIRYLKNIK